MTVTEALGEVQRVGAVEVSGGNLKIRFPEALRPQLEPAIEALRIGKAEALELAAESARVAAVDVLNRTGCRLMALADGGAVGIWSDLDGPQIRAALAMLELGHLPVRYLDGADIPQRYRGRRVSGEPVPMNVLAEMERNPAEPWVVRDRMLNEELRGRSRAAGLPDGGRPEPSAPMRNEAAPIAAEGNL